MWVKAISIVVLEHNDNHVVPNVPLSRRIILHIKSTININEKRASEGTFVQGIIVTTWYMISLPRYCV